MKRWLLASAALLALLPAAANAHFLWFVQAVQDGKTVVHAYFSEDAGADDPALLDRLTKLVAKQATAAGEAEELKLAKAEDSLTAALKGTGASIVVGHCDFGVIARGDAKFKLVYYAKGGPSIDDAAWKKIDSAKHLDLDVVPAILPDGKIGVTVTWKGKPAAKAEVTAVIPNVGNVKAESDDQGKASFEKNEPGLYAIRARVMEDVKGEQDGKAYDSIRHYSSVTFQLPGKTTVTAAKTPVVAEVTQLASLTPPVTSLGGAIVGDALYIYGGNLGSAHSYSNKGQNNELRKLNLSGTGAWEKVSDGPALQGLALVAHDNKLYRIGGFTAKNEEGAEKDLWSQDSAAAFDVTTGEWSDLPKLPEPRSSHDAAVLGDTLYVVGGWRLGGKDSQEWHKTAWSLDLKVAKPEWKALPETPFERRALSAAAHDGKLYVIGGMKSDNKPCTLVSIFDPKTQKWSEGPSIQGEGMAGFGNSSFATGGALYVSTSKGTLQRLAADASAWEIVQELPRARFFHRMLPVDDHRFVMVGGANMETGKFEEVDIVSVR
jgi:N-acetylneuraminic acid mutarotase